MTGRPGAFRCARCQLIICIDLLGEGVETAELDRKIAAHAPKCATPEDLEKAT